MEKEALCQMLVKVGWVNKIVMAVVLVFGEDMPGLICMI